MRMIIAKMADMVPLTDEQLAALDTFTDAAIQHALSKLKRAKSVRDPAAYLMYILRSNAGLEHQGPSLREQLHSSSVRQELSKKGSSSSSSSAERFKLYTANQKAQPREPDDMAYYRLINELSNWKIAVSEYKDREFTNDDKPPIRIPSHIRDVMLTLAQRCVHNIELELSEILNRMPPRDTIVQNVSIEQNSLSS